MSTALSLSFLNSETTSDQPPIVFLHGIGGGAKSWTPQIESFPGNWRRLALDLPGYGSSPHLQDTTFEGLSNALLGFLDQQNLDRIHLVGHSIGGMIAQEFVMHHSERLISLTLSATSPAFGRPDGDFQRQFIAARLKPLKDGQTMEVVAETVVPELVGKRASDDGISLAKACMSKVPSQTYKGMMECLVTFDRKANLPQIKVPTLVLAAEEDTQAPASMMERMAQKIPDAQFVCLKGVGHLANIEDPENYNSALTRFISDY